ncbi:N-acetylneuraminate lyase-like isoform X2 [Watersipora subatra]
MTIEERKRTAEEWARLAKGRFSLILNVSCTNLKDACDLAAHAELVGADAISAHTPLFFTPTSIESLVECLATIAASAPNTPFYYYDINFMTATNFDNGEVFAMAIEKIPTFRGMKQSSREIAYLVKSVLRSQEGRYQVIIGNELLLCGLPMGIRIPVCLPYAGRIFTRMVEAFDRGDMKAAALEQERMQTIQSLLKKYGGGAKKALSAIVGMDLGPSRLPIKDPTPEELDNMRKDVDRLGIKEYI